MPLFEPDRYFSRISHINIQHDLINRGLMYGLVDIDNTLLTRDTHEIPRDVGLWLGEARDAGFTICLVSNNFHESVFQVADSLELPIVARAVKPLPPAFLMALHKLKAKRKDTVVIGDQLMTDVLGAHLLGMLAYLLQPLVEQDLPHTLFLRNFERIAMGGRQPEPEPTRSAYTTGAYGSVKDASRSEQTTH